MKAVVGRPVAPQIHPDASATLSKAVRNAAILLDQRQNSIAAIVSDGVAKGVIGRDGLTAGEQAISTLATGVPMVDAGDGAEATIRMLRDRAAPFALVMEHDHPVGILNPAEALLSLV